MSRSFNHLRAFEADFTAQVEGETRLWRAVIIQAIVDAQKNKTETMVQMGVRGSVPLASLGLNWFVSAGFEEICDLAGVDPDWLRAKAFGLVSECLSERRARCTQ